MANLYEIRANYDKQTIVMYQAYSSNIADLAIKNQKFVKPFSFNRMTWIKPSFLWLMHRSNWAKKSGQERILAVHITRSGWEKALSLGVLTSPEKTVHSSGKQWEQEFNKATVHIQWDTERSPRGAALQHFSIQVGLSRHIINEFVDEWIVKIEDITAVVHKINKLKAEGNKNFTKFIPSERIYPISQEIGRRIMIST